MKQWVLDAYQDAPEDQKQNAIKKHFIAVSTAKNLVEDFGIDSANMFGFWDWVGGRYSMWSAVGLSMATFIGFDNFLEFLEGGREADEHFRSQPFKKNIPVLKALLNVWYGNFKGAQVFAILPYDQYLDLFPDFSQQFFMESNGKRVDRNGNPVDYSTGLSVLGRAGTNGQHSFYQLLHQLMDGMILPADFIGVLKSHNDLPGHHDKLFANYVAQTEALAFGLTKEEVLAILAGDSKYADMDEEFVNWLAEHKTFTGNKPTTSILIDQVTPRTLGNFVAIYEHQIFTEGILWDIFSFDQMGVEEGKRVAVKKVLPSMHDPEELPGSGLSPSGQYAVRRFVEANTIDEGDGLVVPGSEAPVQLSSPITADELISKYKNDPNFSTFDLSELKAVSAEDRLPPAELDAARGTFKAYDIRGNDKSWWSNLKNLLTKFSKDYIRDMQKKYPLQITPNVLTWQGRALGSLPVLSSDHGRAVGLQKGDIFLVARDNGPTSDSVSRDFIQGLLDTGVNVVYVDVVNSGALYSLIKKLGAKGGAYITRSHTEIGINGIKPNIDGITLFGDMIQAMIPAIETGVYRQVSAAERGKLLEFDSLWDVDANKPFLGTEAEKTGKNLVPIREHMFDLYAESIRKMFGGLKDAPIKVTVNFNGGSATSQRADGSKYYPALFSDVLGTAYNNPNLSEEDAAIFREDGDSWNERGPLADPSQKNELKAVIAYSQAHPDEIILNFDLDVDRIGIVWGGRAYLGDEIFSPIVEYMLSIDPTYKKYLPTILYDSRMNARVRTFIAELGGTDILADKGHSIVKANMDVLMKRIADMEGKTVEQFMQDHPVFVMVQPEYSLHMFMTDDTGSPFDDALRFSLFWLKAFSEIREKHGNPNLTLEEYLDNLGLYDQLREQRTFVEDVDGKYRNDLKGKIVDGVAEKILAWGEGRDDFQYFESAKAFNDFKHVSKGTLKPYTLVFLPGSSVYHFYLPDGEFFFGISNTAAKIAFGTQSPTEEGNKKLALSATALIKLISNEVGKNAGTELKPINNKETADLYNMFGLDSAAAVENLGVSKYGSAEAAVEAMTTPVASSPVGLNVVSLTGWVKDYLDGNGLLALKDTLEVRQDPKVPGRFFVIIKSESIEDIKKSGLVQELSQYGITLKLNNESVEKNAITYTASIANPASKKLEESSSPSSISNIIPLEKIREYINKEVSVYTIDDKVVRGLVGQKSSPDNEIWIFTMGDDTDGTGYAYKPNEITLIVEGLESSSTYGYFDAPVAETTSSPIGTEQVGGINLDPTLMNLQIKRDGNGIPLPVSQQPIQTMNIEGFYPVIINIMPAPPLPMQMGEASDDNVTDDGEGALSLNTAPSQLPGKGNERNDGFQPKTLAYLKD